MRIKTKKAVMNPIISKILACVINVSLVFGSFPLSALADGNSSYVPKITSHVKSQCQNLKYKKGNETAYLKQSKVCVGVLTEELNGILAEGKKIVSGQNGKSSANLNETAQTYALLKSRYLKIIKQTAAIERETRRYKQLTQNNSKKSEDEKELSEAIIELKTKFTKVRKFFKNKLDVTMSTVHQLLKEYADKQNSMWKITASEFAQKAGKYGGTPFNKPELPKALPMENEGYLTKQLIGGTYYAYRINLHKLSKLQNSERLLKTQEIIKLISSEKGINETVERQKALTAIIMRLRKDMPKGYDLTLKANKDKQFEGIIMLPHFNVKIRKDDKNKEAFKIITETIVGKSKERVFAGKYKDLYSVDEFKLQGKTGPTPKYKIVYDELEEANEFLWSFKSKINNNDEIVPVQEDKRNYSNKIITVWDSPRKSIDKETKGSWLWWGKKTYEINGYDRSIYDPKTNKLTMHYKDVKDLREKQLLSRGAGLVKTAWDAAAAGFLLPFDFGAIVVSAGGAVLFSPLLLVGDDFDKGFAKGLLGRFVDNAKHNHTSRLIFDDLVRILSPETADKFMHNLANGKSVMNYAREMKGANPILYWTGYGLKTAGELASLGIPVPVAKIAESTLSGLLLFTGVLKLPRMGRTITGVTDATKTSIKGWAENLIEKIPVVNRIFKAPPSAKAVEEVKTRITGLLGYNGSLRSQCKRAVEQAGRKLSYFKFKQWSMIFGKSIKQIKNLSKKFPHACQYTFRDLIEIMGSKVVLSGRFSLTKLSKQLNIWIILETKFNSTLILNYLEVIRYGNVPKVIVQGRTAEVIPEHILPALKELRRICKNKEFPANILKKAENELKNYGIHSYAKDFDKYFKECKMLFEYGPLFYRDMRSVSAQLTALVKTHKELEKPISDLKLQLFKLHENNGLMLSEIIPILRTVVSKKTHRLSSVELKKWMETLTEVLKYIGKLKINNREGYILTDISTLAGKMFSRMSEDYCIESRTFMNTDFINKLKKELEYLVGGKNRAPF